MSYSNEAIRIGLLGCGTVGGGVLRLLRDNASELSSRVGAPLEVAKVLVRDKGKSREGAFDAAWLTTDPAEILDDPSIDIVVESMGGTQPAYDYVRRAIEAGKSVVTANKMLLAQNGPELMDRAIAHRVALAFEASVGGGIPIVRTLREALAGDVVERLYGIVNGTCNYMLSRMREEGLDFDEALREAQEQGYAEADPALDIDGHDAAHKMVVLAMLAFGARLEGERIFTEGIREIEAIDHRFASRFGFVIKHLAIGREREGSLELRVHPALVPKESVLASVGGVLNAIFLEGKALGPCLLSGRGAGAMPTAVSVVSDIVDVAKRKIAGSPGPGGRIALRDRALSPLDDLETRYYLRFTVEDRPRVLASLTGSLGDHGVSIEQMVQDGHGSSRSTKVSVVMITHEARELSIRRALAEIGEQSYLVRPPRLLRIEEV